MMRLCTSCTLYRQASSLCVWGESLTKASSAPADFIMPSTRRPVEIVLVGQNPGKVEDLSGRPFVGPTGTSLRKMLEEKFPDVGFYLTNAVKCHTTDDKTPSLGCVKTCAQKHLKSELDGLRPIGVLALGSVAWAALSNIYHLNIDFSGMVGNACHISDLNTMLVGAAYHPSLGFENSKSIKGSSAAVQGSRVFRQIALVIEGMLSVGNKSHLLDFAKNDLEAIDVENDTRQGAIAWKGPLLVNGRENYDGPIRIEQFATPPKKVMGWNVGYDLMVLWEKYGYFIPEVVTDVKAWYRVLNDEEATLPGLKQAALTLGQSYWGPMVPRKRYVDGLMEWSHHELSAYNTRDLQNTRLLYESLISEKWVSPELCDLDSEVLGLVCPSMEWWGTAVDKAQVVFLKGKHQEESDRCIAKIGAEADVLTSPAQLLKYLNGLGYNLKTTSDADLSGIEDKELLETLKRFRYSQKVLSTFLMQIERFTDEEGIVHFPYKGTAETGRLKNRGLHQLPKSDEIRKCLVARPGHCFIKADVAQLEIGGIALRSGDEKLIGEVKEGVDVHKKTLEAALELGFSDSFTRQEAKSFNFAAMYGGSAPGLAKRFGLKKHEAQALIDYLYKEYPRLLSWHKEVEASLKEGKDTVSIFGRSRRLFSEYDYGHTLRKFPHHFLREAINFQIQSYGADLTKHLMCQLFHNLDCNKGSTKLLMYIHDEFVVECREEDVETIEIPGVLIGQKVLGVTFPFEVRWEIQRGLPTWK